MDKNDGGPAFPFVLPPPTEDVQLYHEGMSLRDWFAGQALAGALAFPGSLNFKSDKDSDTAARISYEMADAMLAAREGK